MNIAMFTDTYPPHVNGVATSVHTLAEELRKRGHRVIIVTTRNGRGKTIIEGDVVRISGMVIKKLYGMTWGNLYSTKAMKFLKEANLDLIHYHSDLPLGWFALMAKKHFGVPAVYTYHTMLEDYTIYVTKGNPLFDKAGRKLMRNYSKITAKDVSTIICPSQKAYDYMKSIGVKTPLTIIPTGIDISYPTLSEKDILMVEEFKKAHGYTEKTKTILSLSRLAEEKSIGLSLSHFKGYLNTYPEADIRFVIAGDGPDKKKFIKKAEELGIIDKTIFVGAVPHEEVNRFYTLADVFLTSSVTETQGLTLIEAMSAKTIVLARHDEPTDALIRENENGYFFEKEEEFIYKLNKVLNLNKEEKEIMHQKMYELLKPYSLEAFTQNVYEVYLNAIK